MNRPPRRPSGSARHARSNGWSSAGSTGDGAGPAAPGDPGRHLAGDGRANGDGSSGAGTTAGADGNGNGSGRPASGTLEAAAGRGKGRSFAAAVKWSYVMDIGRQAVILLVTFILAGILGPEAYGVAALATTYIAFLQLLSTQGMQPAIIQRPNLRPEHPDAAFWMMLTVSLGLMLVTVPLSGWWAAVNHTPELRGVVIVLSFLTPIYAVKVVQESLLRREMNIRPLAVRTNLSVLAGAVVGVVCAVIWESVWALVAQQMTNVILDAVILWHFSAWRPRLRFQWSAAKEMLAITVGSTFASLGTFLTSRADVLITGLFFGPTAVGIYRFASKLIDTAISVTVTSLQGASLPELARYQDDPPRLAGRLVVVMRASALLSLPLLGVLAGVADPLMAAVGPRWELAAVPLMILTIMGAGRALTMLNGPLLQAVGRAGQLAVLSWVAAGISVVSFVAAGLVLEDSSIATQVVAMSWSRAALWGGVFVLINMWVLRRVTSVSLWRVARSAVPSALSGMAAATVGVLVGDATAPFVGGIIRLGVTGTLAAATAGVVLYAADAVVRTSLARNLAARGWGGYAAAAHSPGQVRAIARSETAGLAVAGAALRASDTTPRHFREAPTRRGRRRADFPAPPRDETKTLEGSRR